MSTTPLDAGLQPERTLLAWQRTALAAAAGGVVGAKLLADQVGAWAFGAALVVVALALVAYLATHRTYHRMVAQMASDASGRRPPTLGIAFMAIACAALAVLALWLVLSAS